MARNVKRYNDAQMAQIMQDCSSDGEYEDEGEAEGSDGDTGNEEAEDEDSSGEECYHADQERDEEDGGVMKSSRELVRKKDPPGPASYRKVNKVNVHPCPTPILMNFTKPEEIFRYLLPEQLFGKIVSNKRKNFKFCERRLAATY